MQAITKQDVLDTLTDPHKIRIVNRATSHYKFQIESEELLFSLIMHYHNRTQILTPPTHLGLVKKTWTIGNVVDRLLKEGITFEELAKGDPKPINDPSWFQRFLPLLENFSYDKMDPLLLFIPNNQEQKDCPTGSFKLIDGMHRTLTLTHMIKTNQIKFQPIDAILLTPRIYKY